MLHRRSCTSRSTVVITTQTVIVVIGIAAAPNQTLTAYDATGGGGIPTRNHGGAGRIIGQDRFSIWISSGADAVAIHLTSLHSSAEKLHAS